MFHQLSLFALIAPLVSGLVVEIPQNPTSGGQTTIKWTNQQGDPTTWSFELTNQAFNDAFAIANNVDPSQNSLTLTLPVVPVGDGYTLQAVNIGNISDIFAATGDFSIGAPTTSISSAASTSATSKSVTSKSATGSTSGTTSASATAASSTNTSPGFSSIIVSSPTPSATAGTNSSASTSGTGTGTGASAAATTTSAALSSRMGASTPFGGLAAVVLSAVAGAAMIAL